LRFPSVLLQIAPELQIQNSPDAIDVARLGGFQRSGDIEKSSSVFMVSSANLHTSAMSWRHTHPVAVRFPSLPEFFSESAETDTAVYDVIGAKNDNGEAGGLVELAAHFLLMALVTAYRPASGLRILASRNLPAGWAAWHEPTWTTRLIPRRLAISRTFHSPLRFTRKGFWSSSLAVAAPPLDLIEEPPGDFR